MKIFRDDISGRLRMIFPADHKAYKKNGLYKTFPQANSNHDAEHFWRAHHKPSAIRKKIQQMIKMQMVEPHKTGGGKGSPTPGRVVR